MLERLGLMLLCVDLCLEEFPAQLRVGFKPLILPLPSSCSLEKLTTEPSFYKYAVRISQGLRVWTFSTFVAKLAGRWLSLVLGCNSPANNSLKA